MKLKLIKLNSVKSTNDEAIKLITNVIRTNILVLLNAAGNEKMYCKIDY